MPTFSESIYAEMSDAELDAWGRKLTERIARAEVRASGLQIEVDILLREKDKVNREKASRARRAA